MSQFDIDPLAASLAQARGAIASGQLAQARAACEQALAARPEHAEALRLLGHVHAAAKRYPEALRCFARSAAADPGSVDALADLGAAQLACGRHREALETLSRAAERAPGNALLLHHLGQAHEQRGDFGAAAAFHGQSLAAAPDFAAAHARLGCCLERLGQLDEACVALGTARRLDAADANIAYNFGAVLLRAGRYTEAAGALEQALALGCRTADAYNNLGLACYRLGRMDDAGAHLRQALRINSLLAPAWSNLGNVLMEQGDLGAAISHLERAVQIDGGAEGPQLNLAIAYLTAGDYARAWPLFDARLLPGPARVGLSVPAGLPLWDPRTLVPERSLVLVTEQGLGDAIQFARFGAELAARGLRPVLQCPGRLQRLLSTAPGFAEVFPEGTQYPPDRYQWFPLLSVPGVLGTSLATLPAQTPYLQAEAELVADWRARLGPGPMRIGLVWQGDAGHERDSVFPRSLPLVALGPLIEIEGVEWVSLQKGAGSEALAQVPWSKRVHDFGDALDPGPDAFLDTAALLMSLDLVITCDTGVAHLAGALGRPAWVALTYMPDWRWMVGREDSPWYPGMRLFRQRRQGDWSGVIADLRAALEAEAAGRRAQ